MTKVRARVGARLLAVGCAAAVVGGFMPISSTSGSPFPARLSSLVPIPGDPFALGQEKGEGVLAILDLLTLPLPPPATQPWQLLSL